MSRASRLCLPVGLLSAVFALAACGGEGCGGPVIDSINDDDGGLQILDAGDPPRDDAGEPGDDAGQQGGVMPYVGEAEVGVRCGASLDPCAPTAACCATFTLVPLGLTGACGTAPTVSAFDVDADGGDGGDGGDDDDGGSNSDGGGDGGDGDDAGDAEPDGGGDAGAADAGNEPDAGDAPDDDAGIPPPPPVCATGQFPLLCDDTEIDCASGQVCCLRLVIPQSVAELASLDVNSRCIAPTECLAEANDYRVCTGSGECPGTQECCGLVSDDDDFIIPVDLGICQDSCAADD